MNTISQFAGFLLLSLAAIAVRADELTPEQRLRLHSQEFEQQIVSLDHSVHVAVGFGASNVSMIEGEDGLIIIDTAEGTGVATEILAAFRKISTKPVRAIIYTHSHRDHISGASVFAGEDLPQIYARENFASELVEGTVVAPILKARTQRQFGLALDSDSERINIGIGREVRSDGLGTGYLPATMGIKAPRHRIRIAGIDIELVAAPGETGDQLYVWLPEQQMVFAGDNFYRAFPNLYPIRGSRYRDVLKWAESLERMRAEQPRHLIPGHTRPVSGTDEVDRALSDYAAAIRYVHHETVRGMNSGLTPDQLVESVVLPTHLAESPYLQPFYGTVAWGVRSVFSGYLGWFDGNPTHLIPLSEREQAKRVVALGGGPAPVLARLREAVAGGDYQWSLQLSDYLLACGHRTEEVTALRVVALEGLAGSQLNAPARNYYLSVARELRGRCPSCAGVDLSRP